MIRYIYIYMAKGVRRYAKLPRHVNIIWVKNGVVKKSPANKLIYCEFTTSFIRFQKGPEHRTIPIDDCENRPQLSICYLCISLKCEF